MGILTTLEGPLGTSTKAENSSNPSGQLFSMADSNSIRSTSGPGSDPALEFTDLTSRDSLSFFSPFLHHRVEVFVQVLPP